MICIQYCSLHISIDVFQNMPVRENHTLRRDWQQWQLNYLSWQGSTVDAALLVALIEHQKMGQD